MKPFLMKALFLALLVCQTALAQTNMALNKILRRTLKAGEVHAYTVPLRKGEFASIRIQQTSIGVGYFVYAPTDSLIDNADLTALYQDEVIQIAATKSGNYTVKVFWDYSIYHKPEGDYSIVWDRKEALGADSKARIHQKFDSWYRTSEPGAAVALVEKGNVTYSHAKGLANVEHRVKLGLDTPIEIASCSKQFTGYAIALLLQANKLSLDDEVKQYVPELPDFAQKIQVRHLLAHTTGLRNWDEVAYIAGNKFDDIIDKTLILNELSSQNQLNFTPGERFEYSNTGYFLLSRVVEKVSGISFGAYCKTHIFDPLGMRHTVVKERNDQLIPNGAYSYKKGAGGDFIAIPNNYSAPGSTSIQTSVHDLVKWVNHLDYGVSGNLRKILQTTFTTNKGDTIQNHAFGNFYGYYKGLYRIDHLGLTLGYRAAIARFPAQKKAIIFLSNDGLDATYSRYNQLCDELLTGIKKQALQPVDFPDLNAFLRETALNLQPTVPAEAAKWAGHYFCRELNTPYLVKFEPNTLAIKLPRLEPIRLKSIAENTFQTTSFARNYVLKFQAGGFYLSSGNLKALWFEKVAN